MAKQKNPSPADGAGEVQLDAERYRALRAIALADDPDAWFRFYFLTDSWTPRAAARFDREVDALLQRTEG